MVGCGGERNRVAGLRRTRGRFRQSRQPPSAGTACPGPSPRAPFRHGFSGQFARGRIHPAPAAGRQGVAEPAHRAYPGHPFGQRRAGFRQGRLPGDALRPRRAAAEQRRGAGSRDPPHRNDGARRAADGRGPHQRPRGGPSVRDGPGRPAAGEHGPAGPKCRPAAALCARPGLRRPRQLRGYRSQHRVPPPGTHVF